MRCAGAFSATRARTGPETLEGQIVRVADKIAYINHDIDDAMRGGIIYPLDIPLDISQVLGFDHGGRINTLTGDVIQASQGKGEIVQSPACGQAMAGCVSSCLRRFITTRWPRGRSPRPRI